MAHLIRVLMSILTLFVNGANTRSLSEPEPSDLYPIFARMIKKSEDLHNKTQFVAGLLISPNEVATNIDDAFKDRFGVYNNKNVRGHNIHGEIQLLENVDTLFKKYPNDDDAEPYLLLFTTNIPCNRCYDSVGKTDCSGSLRTAVENRTKNDQRTFKLVIAFIGVYSRCLKMNKTNERFDITSLDNALNNLLQSHIYLAFITKKTTRDLVTAHKNTLADIRKDPSEYDLSDWITGEPFDERVLKLQNKYSRCCEKVQDPLFACLYIFFGNCDCLRSPGGGTPEPVLRYAIDWAMKRCIHGEGAPLYQVTNPLSDDNKNELRQCLVDNWAKHINHIKCNQCRGRAQNIAIKCIDTAMKARTVGCPTRKHFYGWTECTRLDTNYDSQRFTLGYDREHGTRLPPRCQLKGMLPEYLCTIDAHNKQEPPPPKKRFNE